jgi:hypothetical protein
LREFARTRARGEFPAQPIEASRDRVHTPVASERRRAEERSGAERSGPQREGARARVFALSLSLSLSPGPAANANGRGNGGGDERKGETLELGWD